MSYIEHNAFSTIWIVVVRRTKKDSPKLSKANGDKFYLDPDVAWKKCEKINKKLGSDVYSVIEVDTTTVAEFRSKGDIKEYDQWGEW